MTSPVEIRWCASAALLSGRRENSGTIGIAEPSAFATYKECLASKSSRHYDLKSPYGWGADAVSVLVSTVSAFRQSVRGARFDTRAQGFTKSLMIRLLGYGAHS